MADDETLAAQDLEIDGADPRVSYLPPGSRFAERYRVEARIGEGGMGAVYRVRDEKLDEIIALKVLTLAGDRALKGFLKEVRLARRVTHPNVARTHDLGEDGGTHFLTMELVPGAALDDVLDARGAFSEAEAIAIGIDVAKGLSAAHAAGVVHRDLKPANILLTDEGRAVITDFGIARSAGIEATLGAGAMIGTPAYMAPEQVSGAAVDARTDVYALGIILFELVTDALPFEGDTPIASLTARLTSPPIDPREIASISDPLAHLILRCLARDPADRPTTSSDVRDALEGLVPRDGDTPTSGLTRSGLYAPLAPKAHTLAVLPFVYRGPEEHAYLGEGLAEEVIDVLARTRELKVLSLGATRRFAADRDPKQVATELRVQAVVDGTVQRSGDRVRLAARLVGEDGVQRWTDRFEGSAEDVFEMQEKLARRVAEALRLEVGATLGGEAGGEAVELYLRARRKLTGRTDSRPEDALAMLDRALAQSPMFAPAKAAHAVAAVRAWWGDQLDGHEARAERARSSVERALADASGVAESHLAAAMMAVQEGRFRDAARALGRALDIAPTLAEAHAYLGGLQAEAGHAREGMARLEEALVLDPRLVITHQDIARTALLGGDLDVYARAEEAIVEAYPPHHFGILVSRLRWALWRGDHSAARALVATARDLGTQSALSVARLYGPACGEGEAADVIACSRELTEFRATPRFDALLSQLSTEALCLVGETEHALEALEHAAAIAMIDVLWMRACPIVEPLRAHPRFIEAERKVANRAADVWRR